VFSFGISTSRSLVGWLFLLHVRLSETKRFIGLYSRGMPCLSVGGGGGGLRGDVYTTLASVECRVSFLTGLLFLMAFVLSIRSLICVY